MFLNAVHKEKRSHLWRPFIAIDERYRYERTDSQVVAVLGGQPLAKALREGRQTAEFEPTPGMIAAWGLVYAYWGNQFYGQRTTDFVRDLRDLRHRITQLPPEMVLDPTAIRWVPEAVVA